MTTTDIRRVLVVDDDPDIRMLLSMNLEMEGYCVATADDGLAGERAIRELNPDLVLLDVMMPGITGLDVLRSVKADDATRDIPVVMLTAKANDEDVWEGWQAGADYYLTKPFDMEQLLHYIELLQSPQDDEALA